MTSEAQQLELNKPVARFAYFIELHFLSGIMYVCNANMTYTWNSIEWLGLGTVGSIGTIEESASGGASAMLFGLNIAQVEGRSIALGNVEEYRGRPAKMYFCPLDENFALVGDPEICWRGDMDTVSFGLDGEEGNITLKCETSAYGLKRRPALRMNAQQQKSRGIDPVTGFDYATDTGFDFQNSLISNPAKWLSIKFQSQ